MYYLSKSIKILLFSILIFFITNNYLINKKTKDFGDLALENIFFLNSIIKFNEKNFERDPFKKIEIFDEKETIISKYFEESKENSKSLTLKEFTDSHFNQIIKRRAGNIYEKRNEYYAFNETSEDMYDCTFYHVCSSNISVYALTHIFHYTVFKSLPFIELVDVLIISSIIIIFLTFVSSFILTKKFFDYNVSLISACIITTSTYLMVQFNYPMIFSLLIFPLFSNISFICLYKLHKDFSTKNIFILSFILSLLFFNGYPNTQYFLTTLIFIFFLLISYNNRKLFLSLLKLILFSLIMVLLLSSLYSVFFLNENFLYFLHLSFNRLDIFINYYNFLPTKENIEINSIKIIFYKFINILKIIFIGNDTQIEPHGSLYLSYFSYLNFTEKIILILSPAVYFVIKDKYKKLIYLGSLLLIFLYLILIKNVVSPNTNDTYLVVGRSNFNSYFYLLYIIVINIGLLSQYLFAKFNVFNQKKLYQNLFLYTFLISILFDNNQRIKNYDEYYNSFLSTFSSSNQVRSFVKTLNVKEMVLYDLNRYNYFNFLRTDFLNYDFKFDFLKDVENLNHNDYILKEGYFFKNGNIIMNENFFYEDLKNLNDKLNIYKPYKKFQNKFLHTDYIVLKVGDKLKETNLKENLHTKKFQFNDYVVIDGNLDSINFFCENDDNSTLFKFEDIINDITTINFEKNLMTVYSNNIFPDKVLKNNRIIFEKEFFKNFNFNHPIQKIEIFFPFYFYNDKDKGNYIFFNSNQKNFSFKYGDIRSNGNELPGVYQYIKGYQPLFYYSLSSINVEDLSIQILKNLNDKLSGIYIDEKFRGRGVIEFKIEKLNECNNNIEIISSTNNEIKIYDNKIN